MPGTVTGTMASGARPCRPGSRVRWMISASSMQIATAAVAPMVEMKMLLISPRWAMASTNMTL